MTETEAINAASVARVEAEMPSLGLDTDLRSKREFGHILRIHGPHDPRGKQIVDGLVRLVDKAGLEYQEARTKMLRFMSAGELADYHRAQDHFESCIQALHRAINYLEKLRSLGYSNDGRAIVPKPRDLEVLRDEVKNKIREFRDFVEHIEDDIIQGNLADDSNASIHMGWSQASINGAALKYLDVARWCAQIHEIASPLSVVTARVSTPTPGQPQTVTITGREFAKPTTAPKQK